MRLKNNRGFTGIELALVICICGALTAWFGPNLVKSIGTITSGGDKNQQKMSRKIKLSEPVYAVDESTGQVTVVGMKTSDIMTNEAMAIQVPETLWEKFWKMGAMAVIIIVLLSFLGIWPIITLWWNKVIKPKILNAQAELEVIQYEKNELKGDAKLIVRSIDEGLAAMNTSIASAQSTVDTAQQALTAAALDPDLALRSAAISVAQVSKENAQAVLTALINTRKDFLAAMSRRQDSTTKLLVAELKND